MQRRAFLKGCTAALSLASRESRAADIPTSAALDAGFRNPPKSAHPKTWWHWMNGNITASGITADLEAIGRLGLAGFQIFNVGSRTPKGPVTFFSPEWLQLTAHAAKEADRLGLEFAMHNCPGWSSSGGPWITPELAMQQLVWSETFVTGGHPIDLPLSQPYTKLDYYRDALVVAFPSLAGETRPLREMIRAASSSVGPMDPGVLTDGDLSTGIDVRPAVSGQPGFLLLEFTEPIQARAIAVYGVAVGSSGSSSAAEIAVEASDDGIRYRNVCEIHVPSTGGVSDIPGTESFPAVSLRYLRLVMRQPSRISQVRISAGARIRGWHYKNNSASRGGPGQATAPPPGFTAGVPRDSIVDLATVLDISQYMDPQGRLRWDAPAGNWTILRMGHTPTGRHNSSAPDGGLGLDCDKYSRAGIDFHFHHMFDKILPMLRPLVTKGMAGSLIDSYEVGMQNWTSEFPREFQRRCGYDLRRYMPAMTGRVVGSAEESERFLWDVRRLQADLMADNYYGRFAELCRQNGLKSSAEPYSGGPFDEMQIGSRVDIPMAEFWQGGATHRSVKLAASVGHVYGRAVVGAESFTGNPEYSKWQEHPYGLKAQGDWMYAQGLNQFIFHRYALQPHPDAVPGMTMGCYGIHFDRTNTWFERAGEWIRYLSRCQYLLQQGLLVADLVYFEGENAPVEAPTLAVLEPAPPQGYDWDAIDAGAILTRARIDNGRIVLPDGMSYRVLVMREDARLTLNLMRKIRELVRQGMCLVGARPQGSPSLVGYPESDSEVRRIVDELWGDTEGAALVERKVGNGRVFWGQPLSAVLEKLEAGPDFEVTSRSGDAQVYYIHRRIAEDDFYFVCNHKRRPEDLVCTFRVDGKQPEFWDPATGSITPVDVYDLVPGRVRVPIHIDPAGSLFVVFRSPARAQHLVAVARNGTTIVSPQPFAAPQPAPHREVANSFTVGVWVKPELDTPLPVTGRGPLSAPASYVFFPPQGDAVYGEGHVSCGLTAGRNGVGIYERSRAGALPVLTAQIGISGWTHLAVVYKEGVPSLYVNGKFVRRGEKSGQVVHPGIREANLGYGAPSFNGDMTEPELFPEALDEDHIRKLSEAGVPPPEEPLAIELAGNANPELLIWEDGRYLLRDASGKESALRISGTGAPVDLTGPWDVTFPPKRGAPPGVTLPELMSLHRHSDPGVRYFSGTAAYSKSLTISADALSHNKRLYLDLGRVEVIAQVHVNGRGLGTLWKPPYRLDITEAVHPGVNRLEVLVTNLWPNRLIGDEHLPPEYEYSDKGASIKDIGEIKQIPGWFLQDKPKPGIRVTFSTWRHYSKDSPLLESGLLGPVRLRTALRQPLGNGKMAPEH
jgi:hypothetical protein